MSIISTSDSNYLAHNDFYRSSIPVSGTYQYLLKDDVFTLISVDSNLQKMLGYTEDEIKNFTGNISALIFVEDKMLYSGFLQDVMRSPDSQTLIYGYNCRDGNYIYVSDTITKTILPDGSAHCNALVINLSSMNLAYFDTQISRFLPFGIISFPKNNPPLVPYISPELKEILCGDFPRSDSWLNMIHSNGHFLLPFEEQFHIEQVIKDYSDNKASNCFFFSILKPNGQLIKVLGWLDKMPTNNPYSTEMIDSIFFVNIPEPLLFLQNSAGAFSLTQYQNLTQLYSDAWLLKPKENLIIQIRANNATQNLSMPMRESLGRFRLLYICEESYTAFDEKSELLQQEAPAILTKEYPPFQLITTDGVNKQVVTVLLYPVTEDTWLACVQNQTTDVTNHHLTAPFIRSYNQVHSGNDSEGVFVRTFGHFEVFYNGRPVTFSSKKAKELLAILIDRKGGFVSSSEAISLLWEDEPFDTQLQTRYRKIAQRLKNTLEEHGLEYLLINVNGKRRINLDGFICDAYTYMGNPKKYAETFSGVYMADYSWGEVTLAELENLKYLP